VTILGDSTRVSLDLLHRHLESGPSYIAVWQLVEYLAERRRVAPPPEWKAFCEELAAHPLLELLLEDPYSRDARVKPAGYAGDARTLDYVYLRDAGQQAPTQRGRQLFAITTGVPIADAVRDRASTLAREIGAIAGHRSSTAIASIACGHLRELDHLRDLLPHIHGWGIDQDPMSVALCRSRLHGAVTVEVGSIRDVLSGGTRIPLSDVIYASGLFDYLEDRAAGLLLKRMALALNAGGTVLVPNLTPANDEIAYMEAVMDWWMQYRDEAALSRCADAARLRADAFRATTWTTSNGRVAWLRLDRVS
jgi:extracellular factor (EF) 3-hydroxypalmitic acid methyl ester biosynthesis protein